MHAYCFTEGDTSNFGDDLNRWLWDLLIPEQMKVKDNVLLCGIGTILGNGLPAADHYVVFSSGAGYGPPPDDFGGPKWSIINVRGPLSASVLRLDPSKAATDGAMLLATLPEFAPLPDSQREGVVFIPHYEALNTGDWPEVCRRAGVKFLSPHVRSDEVVEAIRRSKLVLADAMHGAIVADAMRVPWVPMESSNRINTFKWMDWTSTLQLPYRPIPLPSLNAIEAFRNRTLGWHGHRYSISEKTLTAARRHFEISKIRKEDPVWMGYANAIRSFTYFAPARMAGVPALSAKLRDNSEQRIDQCASVLRSAASAPSYLSDEPVMRGKIDILLDGLEELKKLSFV